MAEPLQEQIAAAIAERLRGIVEDGGETYWYTVDDVARVVEFSGSHLDDGHGHLLFLRCDTDSESELTNVHIGGTASFVVFIARKDERASANPFDEAASGDVLAPTVISRAVRDVRTALMVNADGNKDVTLGGVVWNVMDGTSEADYSVTVEGWLCATLSFTVRYEYTAPGA